MQLTYSRASIKEDIGTWLKLIRQEHEERAAEGLDLLVEAQNDAEIAFPEIVDDMSVSEKGLTQRFTTIFKIFCNQISRNASVEDGGVKEDVPRLSKVLYLLDFGWSIMNDLLTNYYSSVERSEDESVENAYIAHQQAYSLMSAKRLAIMHYASSQPSHETMIHTSLPETLPSYEEALGMGPIPKYHNHDPKEADPSQTKMNEILTKLSN